MKVCTFCGLKTDDKTSNCASCGSSDFLNVCPNCSNEFEGSFCPDCGTRYNALPAICQVCGTKFYTKACPNCGYIAGTRVNNGPNYGIKRPSIRQDVSFNARFSLALGVLGMFMMPIPLSIIAIVLASKELKVNKNSSMARTGLVLGIIGVIFGVLMIVIYGVSAIVAIARE